MSGDSEAYYLSQKRYFQHKFWTIYGQQAVLDALRNQRVRVEMVHISEEDDSSSLRMGEITQLARQRGTVIHRKPREIIDRITRNRRLNQGIAADVWADNLIFWPPPESATPEQLKEARDRLFHSQDTNSSSQSSSSLSLRCSRRVFLALDGITTPRNVGMILRSAAASGLDGVIIPLKGTCDPTNPLVLISSAGALFRCRIIRCEDLVQCLNDLTAEDGVVRILDAKAPQSVFDKRKSPSQGSGPVIYVIGSESKGISDAVRHGVNRSRLESVSIPMHNNVESLNASVAAALVCYNEKFHNNKNDNNNNTHQS